MRNNTFFKPTPLYKEFMILDLIEKNKDITQREISESIGVSVSMVNSYLDSYEKQGYLCRKYISSKTVKYIITPKGIDKKKLLNIWYLKSSQEIYKDAGDNIIVFLNQIVERGFKKISLYGAGEVAEIILDVIRYTKFMHLEVDYIIDDDEAKNGQLISMTSIVPFSYISLLTNDGILISSYTHRKIIYRKLIESGYPKNKIVQFFE